MAINFTIVGEEKFLDNLAVALGDLGSDIVPRVFGGDEASYLDEVEDGLANPSGGA